jgi:protein-disulfide isomerase
VNGTPTFFINGRRHDGPYDLEALTEAVERV